MLKIILSLFALIFFLLLIVESKSAILSGFIGGILIFLIIISIIFFIYLFVIKTIRWIEIFNNEPNPTKDKNINDIFKFVRRMNTDELKGEIFGLLGLISILISLISPFLIIGYQIILYLKNGFWQPISIIDALRYFEVKWASWPYDWIGLWKILDQINVSIPIFIGFGLLYLAFNSQD